MYQVSDTSSSLIVECVNKSLPQKAHTVEQSVCPFTWAQNVIMPG